MRFDRFFPDIAKNKLCQLVEALIQPSHYTNSKEISILITGLSVDSLASKLRQLGIYANEYPFGKYNFIVEFCTVKEYL